MGYRMSYLTMRGAVYWFRMRLPKGLAKQPVPPWWPDEAAQLVGSKGVLRTELLFSLNTKDYPVAKRRGAIEFMRLDAMLKEAKALLEWGGTITQTDVDAFADHLRRERLASDEAERNQPAGVTITREALPDGGFRQGIMLSSPGDAPHTGGMTDADLQLLQDRAEREREEARRALAKRRLPDDRSAIGEAAIDRKLSAFLRGRGIEKPHTITDDERRQFHGIAAVATREGAEAVLSRNAGDWINTPSEGEASRKAIGPRLQAAFKQWSSGIPSRSIRPPVPKTVMEAALAVRWFVDLHGDMVVSEIKRDHVRRYREAVSQVPGILTAKQRAMKLPMLLKALPKDATGRSSGSIAKHLTLLSGIIAFTAAEHDLRDKVTGWSNPVAGQKPLANTQRDGREAEKRATFDLANLTAIFANTTLIGPERPHGAKGEAVKFFPLIALFAGMRLDEIGQLHIRDVRQHPECGVWMFDLNDDILGKRLKRSRGGRTAAKRFVPMHPELVRCGLLAFHKMRLKEATPNSPLFPGFKPNAEGKWTAEWSKWFGRFLRNDVMIPERRKVFHSFRHTFNDACRDAEISDADQHHLIGHRIAGVNAMYGEGPFFEMLNAKLQRLYRKGRYKGLDLSHLHTGKA
jgi:integrase